MYNNETKMVLSQAKKTVFTAFLIAIGIVLPQAFHFLPIGNTGKVLLPMHIPVFLGGFLLGSGPGLIIGVITPLLSCLFFQMPALPLLPIMMVELAAYGFVAGFVTNRIKNTFLAVFVTQVGGRIAYALAVLLFTYLLKITKVNMEVFYAAIIIGIPGIIAQLIVLPILIKYLKRSV